MYNLLFLCPLNFNLINLIPKFLYVIHYCIYHKYYLAKCNGSTVTNN